MLQSDAGIVNKVLVDYTHLVDERPTWLLGDNTMWAIVIPSIWRGLPLAMLFFLAGLQAIPNELHEAAEIDGADAWRRFRDITLPLLRPLIAIQLLFGVIYAAYQFAIPDVMLGTNPGPDADLMMTLIVRQSFSNNLFGFGAAASTLLMLAMLVWVAVWCRAFRRDLEAPHDRADVSPRARRRLDDRALDALTWLVLAVMLAPIVWLLIAVDCRTSGARDRRPTTCCTRRSTRSATCGRRSTSGSTSSTASSSARRRRRSPRRSRAVGRLRARALPVPGRAAVRRRRDRHAADPRLDVPAAAVPRLRLAQAEHADRAVRHASSG